MKKNDFIDKGKKTHSDSRSTRKLCVTFNCVYYQNTWIILSPLKVCLVNIHTFRVLEKQVAGYGGCKTKRGLLQYLILRIWGGECISLLHGNNSFTVT